MKLSDFTVDSLRSDSYMAHFFGLGFIQVKLDAHTRLHFYHPEIPAFVDEPHDHRYGFVSHVLRGALHNTVYDLTPGTEFKIEYESCRVEATSVPSCFISNLTCLGDFITYAGSGYHMHSEAFHTVHPLFDLGPCVTFVRRATPHKEFARVARKEGSTAICPFSQPLEEDVLWRIVSECLDGCR